MRLIKYMKSQWSKDIHSKLIIILALIFVLSVVLLAISLISRWQDSRHNQDLMTSLQNETIAPSITTTTTTTTTSAEESTEITVTETTLAETEDKLPTNIDFDSLQAKNPDTVAWIEVPGTVINYPIVLTEDNDYYLHRDFSGNESKAGSIFMDYRNGGIFEDRHSILYGHNMRDGSMFAGLMAYKDANFFSENNLIYIDMPDGRTVWQIFAVYVTTVDFYYIITDFADDQAYHGFLQTIESKSLFRSDISPSVDDNLLTLSTCTYEYDDARFVVHAMRID